MIAGWTEAHKLLKDELRQKIYEGYKIPVDLEEAIFKLKKSDVLGDWQARLHKCKNTSDYNSNHPNDLDFPVVEAYALDQEHMFDKFHGAWTGRMTGCALGKPVEIIGFAKDSRLKIKNQLKKHNAWPLDDYFSKGFEDENFQYICPDSLRENISFMEPDDDIHYTVLAHEVIQKHGLDFEWNDIANCWNDFLPYNAICTAETQAILNYNMYYSRLEESYPSHVFTRLNNNPYREWVGAMIRADGWAYIAAGNPSLAARLAYKDASWTHTANGIYAEVFMAVMIATSFNEGELKKLIDLSLTFIPPNSRLSIAVNMACEWMAKEKNFEAYMDCLDQYFGDMNKVHSVNNLCLCLGALFYGDGDFDKSICLAVMGAIDTDSAAATVGSIVGAQKGRKNLQSKLALALNDQAKLKMISHNRSKITDLAKWSLSLWKNINYKI